LPIDDVSLSASTDLDFANAEETDDYSLGFDDVAEDNADEDLRGGRRIRQAVKNSPSCERFPRRNSTQRRNISKHSGNSTASIKCGRIHYTHSASATPLCPLCATTIPHSQKKKICLHTSTNM